MIPRKSVELTIETANERYLKALEESPILSTFGIDIQRTTVNTAKLMKGGKQIGFVEYRETIKNKPVNYQLYGDIDPILGISLRNAIETPAYQELKVKK